MVTFPVDEVVPATQLLPTHPLVDLYPEAIFVAGDPNQQVLKPDGVHPLLSAVSRAFSEHRPLVLSPDAVWLTIAAGVAQHVRLNAETLRPQLVRHAGRKRLQAVIETEMPLDEVGWREVVLSLTGQLAAEIDDPDLFECDFSTSTDLERLAGKVVLLDVYTPYFSIWLKCICGIPSVTLTGTVADWQRIRARIDRIRVFGLGTWCRSLVPIADELLQAAEGEANLGFWKRIYNPADAYGGAWITGWVARLYPYLSGRGGYTTPNPLLKLPIDEPRDWVTDKRWGYDGPGVRSDMVPANLSRVVVKVNDRVNRTNATVALHAGLVAVAQDPDGALRPVAGWHLAPATVEIDDVIDRLIREHEVTAVGVPMGAEGPADVVALFDRVDSASLFGGQWRILPVLEHCVISMFDDKKELHLVMTLAMPDGRYLFGAMDLTREQMHWVASRIVQVPVSEAVGVIVTQINGSDDTSDAAPKTYPQLLDDPDDIPVYGTSLALILQTIMDGEPLELLETGRLADLAAYPARAVPEAGGARS